MAVVGSVLDVIRGVGPLDNGACDEVGFIYTLDDPAEQEWWDTIGSLICIGVRTVEDAPAIAYQLVSDGVERIELCGGFGGAGLGAVVSAVSARVPVGAFFYGVDASSGLQRLFRSGESALPSDAPQTTRADARS